MKDGTRDAGDRDSAYDAGGRFRGGTAFILVRQRTRRPDWIFGTLASLYSEGVRSFRARPHTREED
jgi:hypothetical protein